MKPVDAIKKKEVVAKPSAPTKNANEERVASGVDVRYLYQPGELEGGDRKRATDPIWSLDLYQIGSVIAKPGEPMMYYLENGPKRGFVKQELLIVPSNTQLPPDGVLKR